MKITTTLALLILVGAGFTAFWYAAPKKLAVETTDAVRKLAELKADTITQVRVQRKGETLADLRRLPTGSWVVDGNWPASPTAVQELLSGLTGLQSRFRPEAADFKASGNSLQVELTSTLGKHTITLFEQPGEEYRYLAPTFALVDQEKQPVRVTPGLLATVERPSDRYRQLQIFPAERYAKMSAPQERIDRLDAASLVVQMDKETPIKLVRTAEGWEVSEPSRDRLDPEAAEKLLSAIAELSVRQFTPVEVPAAILAVQQPENPWQFGATLALIATDAVKRRAGLDQPERSLTVTRTDGSVVKLLIGKPLSDEPPPPMPPRGPRPDTFRFGTLEGSGLLFEFADTRLSEIFVPLAQLRDARVARFNPDDVEELTLTEGSQTAVLYRDGKDVWKMRSPRTAAADSDRVKELLTKLSTAEAPERDRDLFSPARRAALYAASTLAPAASSLSSALLGAAISPSEGSAGLDRPTAIVSVKLREKSRPDDRSPSKERTLTLRLGKPEGAPGKQSLQVEGWPRIDQTDDALARILERPTLTFRGKQPLDFKPEDVQRITIRTVDAAAVGTSSLGLLSGATGSVALLREKVTPLILERSGDAWSLASLGSADATKAADLADALSKFRVAAHIADEVSAEKLQSAYGLTVPQLRVLITFTDPAKPAQELAIGRPRDLETGNYARLNASSDVFAVSEELVSKLERPALAYFPAQLWQIPPNDDIVRFRITRAGQDEYQLSRKDGAWQVTGPFTVAAPLEVIEKLSSELTSPKAVAYRATSVPNPAEYGLELPAVKVSITTRQGKEFHLVVGQRTLAGGKPGRYARLGQTGGVFVIADTLAQVVNQSALDFLDRRLLRFDALAVTKFSRVRNAETLTVERAEDGWKITKPSEQSGDDRKIGDLLRRLGELQASRVVAYKPKTLDTFGLDKPEATLTLSLGEGQPAETLLIGKEAAPGERYAVVKGQPTVGVLSEQAGLQILASSLSLRSHDLARVPDADTIKLTAGDRKITFTRPEGTWKVSQPITADADHESLEAMIGGLARLRADDLIAEKPTPVLLKAFGLDKPAAVWQLFNGDEAKLDLAIGGADGKGRRYAKLADRDLVFVLDTKLSAQCLTEYRPRQLWKENVDPAQVEGVKFTFPKGGFELRKIDGVWQALGQPDVKLVPATVDDTLSVLRELKLSRYVKDSKAQLKLYGLDPVALELEVTTPTGKFRLDIGGRFGETNRRYARVPGKGDAEAFLLDEATSTKLFRDLSAMQKPLK